VKLSKEDQAFRNTKVFYPDPKTVELDRVLVRLYLLLRCKGTRPATKVHNKANWDKVRHHRERLAAMKDNVGFAEHAAVAQAWLESDVFDVVNRGKGDAEGIASLRPLHLDAIKIHIAPRCRDYNVADHLYACLREGEARTVDALRDFLDRGRDLGSDNAKPGAKLDLETLALLKLVEGLGSFEPSGNAAAPDRPVCVGQARVLCDDVNRLLAYQDAVPRAVMIEYLRTIFGLHTALYTLRMSRQLTGWLADRKANEVCRACPVQGGSDQPFAGCPYGMRFLTDMGDDYRSRMARMAQASAAAEWGRMEDLIRSIFATNQLLRYSRARNLTPAEAVDQLSDPPATFDGFFEAMLETVRSSNTPKEGALPDDVQAILTMAAPPFDRFVELITHVRYRHHREYLNQMLDKLFQKNTEYAAVVQGKSTGNPRRWHLGSRLLEVFVQLAVLRVEVEGGKRRYVARPLLIDDFVRWIDHRYGFVLSGTLDAAVPPTLDEHAAFRRNINALKTQLREIGFFDDLSDAFNAQTIRPRYPIRSEATE
jgi:hypothetical protein